MKKRILIVDDDVMTLKILKKYLDDDFCVITENAGYRFVEKMDSYEVDLILLDLEMPVVNGIQAFEAVLANPKMRDIPVAFLTGVTNPGLVRELIQKGAAGYLVKTTPKGELVSRINKILSSFYKREMSGEVMILHDDIEVIKQMRDTLVEAGYKVKPVRNMMEAMEYMRSHHPNIFVIGNDSTGVGPREIYDSLSNVIHEERVVAILMESPFFSSELLDRIRENLGE